MLTGRAPSIIPVIAGPSKSKYGTVKIGDVNLKKYKNDARAAIGEKKFAVTVARFKEN